MEIFSFDWPPCFWIISSYNNRHKFFSSRLLINKCTFYTSSSFSFTIFESFTSIRYKYWCLWSWITWIFIHNHVFLWLASIQTIKEGLSLKILAKSGTILVQTWINQPTQICDSFFFSLFNSFINFSNSTVFSSSTVSSLSSPSHHHIFGSLSSSSHHVSHNSSGLTGVLWINVHISNVLSSFVSTAFCCVTSVTIHSSSVRHTPADSRP